MILIRDDWLCPEELVKGFLKDIISHISIPANFTDKKPEWSGISVIKFLPYFLRIFFHQKGDRFRFSLLTQLSTGEQFYVFYG